MQNKVWGYTKCLLLGIITATALLWSMTVVPAAASPLRQPEPLSLSSSDLRQSSVAIRAKDGIRGSRPGFRLGGRNDEEEGLALSLPFAVESHWESASDNTPGIVWTTSIPSTDGQIVDSQIKFGIKNGQFIASATDTWFIYGWFGALQAIKQPYNVKYPEWGDRHNGIDFAGQEGIEITSASNGTVILAGKKIGNTVIVNAGNGYRITYGHLQDISVKKGDKIKAGDLIGHLGDTGTINPHLHFQVDLIKKGSRTAINPVPLINTEWGSIVIPNADANQFYTDNQNPLTQPDFNW